MKKWEVCFLIGDKMTKCAVEADGFGTGVLGDVLYAEFRNYETCREQVAFYSNVIYVHLVGQGVQDNESIEA